VCAVAIADFGQHGFDVEPHDIADAAEVGEATLRPCFGAAPGLRMACNELIERTTGAAKSAALTSADPADWPGQVAAIASTRR